MGFGVLCLYILPSIFFFLRSRAASALSRLRNFFFISLSSGALSCGPRGSPLCGLGNTGRTLTLWKGILLYLELIVSLSFWLPLFVYRRVDQLQYVRYNVSCCEIRSIPHCASVALNDGFSLLVSSVFAVKPQKKMRVSDLGRDTQKNPVLS